MIFHRRPRPEPPPPVEDDWSDEVVALANSEGPGVPLKFARGSATAWFETTPVDHSVHHGKYSTTLTPSPTEGDERRWRVQVPVEPQRFGSYYDDQKTTDRDRFGPWDG